MMCLELEKGREVNVDLHAIRVRVLAPFWPSNICFPPLYLPNT